MPLLLPDETLELPGVAIRSEGVGAIADAVPVGVPGGRDPQEFAPGLVDLGTPAAGAGELARALADSDLRIVTVVPLEELTTSGGGAGLRADDAGPALVLTVEAPGADEGQVVLEVDASGVVSWHLPATGTESMGARAGLDQVFRVPVRQVGVPGPPAAGADRGLLGFGIRKILHVLRYPVERVAGGVAEFLVARWEEKNRPHGLRRVTGDVLAGAPGFGLGHDELRELSGKPTLLLVHGTFSTAAAGFAGLARDAAVMSLLRARYEGRVLVLDHPSVSVDPIVNARWLLERIPADVDLVLDVVAHSRGGLVGRALTAAPTFLRPGVRLPVVRRIVHVATPNAGTPLAETRRWGTLLDSVTNLAMLFPDVASVPLVAVLQTVKQLGTGALAGLDGLAAMDPAGPFLPALVPAGGQPQFGFAIASDFEPHDGSVAVRALDVLVDSYFSAGNDLVVPTAGVGAAAGIEITESVTVPGTPAVNHSGYFGQSDVRSRIAGWLA